MNTVNVRRALRAIAVVIAIAAAIDPAITANHAGRPDIAVIGGDGARDSVLRERITQTLSKTFTIVPAGYPGAAATVIAGSAMPVRAHEMASPIFAVSFSGDGPTALLEDVHAPRASALQSRVPITADVRATGAKGRWIQITLRSGELVIDRATRPVSTDDQRVQVPLTFVPAVTGTAQLNISAQITGERSVPAAAALAIDVIDKKWSVLFFDPRPSWMSTFVRRALEKDNRFVVTSRVVTAKNVSADAGQVPARLDDLAAVGIFDAVVIGAPEGLSDRDVAGLDAFLRRRGGTVVLLLDQRTAGAYDRLTDAGAWAGTKNSKGIVITPVNAGSADSSANLRASEIAWPARLPAGAEPLARSSMPASGQSVIWQLPTGAGRLVVSGALDSWRFRDRVQSGFDRFWQNTIADAANASPARLSVFLSDPVAAPGEQNSVRVTVRDAALQPALPVRANVSATLETGSFGAPESQRSPIRLWPDGTPGHFIGQFTAPLAPGSYRLAVTSDGAQSSVPLIVAAHAEHPTLDDGELLNAWLYASGGQSITSGQLAKLPALLTAAIRPASRLERWHPMRSAWWILPFAAALAAEWLLRRKAGLP